jgi:hypothetical protein
MLGGEFISHGSQQEARVKVVDPKFPGLPGSAEAFTKHVFARQKEEQRRPQYPRHESSTHCAFTRDRDFSAPRNQSAGLWMQLEGGISAV